jgi:hypothetical protein
VRWSNFYLREEHLHARTHASSARTAVTSLLPRPRVVHVGGTPCIA